MPDAFPHEELISPMVPVEFVEVDDAPFRDSFVGVPFVFLVVGLLLAGPAEAACSTSHASRMERGRRPPYRRLIDESHARLHLEPWDVQAIKFSSLLFVNGMGHENLNRADSFLA
ncbi:MAG: hypothetical protein SFV15_05355 [Polyangiaceae bacterium]|nr:hypothetical protein [Polyangiaceae bacterium]